MLLIMEPMKVQLGLGAKYNSIKMNKSIKIISSWSDFYEHDMEHVERSPYHVWKFSIYKNHLKLRFKSYSALQYKSFLISQVL